MPENRNLLSELSRKGEIEVTFYDDVFIMVFGGSEVHRKEVKDVIELAIFEKEHNAPLNYN